MHRFRVPADQATIPGPTGEQARADAKRLDTICRHVIKSRDRPAARQEADQLMALADACIADKASQDRQAKLRWFTFKAKQEYPGLFQKGDPTPCN
jgi:hypothetical protein